VSVVSFEARQLKPALLAAPPSKSDAVRALVLAHALEWPALAQAVRSACEPPASDVRVVAEGLAALRSGAARIDCEDGGAPFRFLLGQAAAWPGARVQLTGSERLGRRPHAALFEAREQSLGPAGLSLSRGTPWPVEVKGGARASLPLFRVRGAQSSQFASSLVLAAAALAHREHRVWTLELEGPLASSAYLELTVAWAQRCGVPISQVDRSILLGPTARPKSPPAVPSDWSALGYLLPIAWKTGAVVSGLEAEAEHPDRAVVDHLRGAGLRLSDGPRVRVLGKARGGLRASAAQTPDLILTLVALACVLEEPSVFTEVEVLRGKESDRLAAAVALARAAGARSQLQHQTLVIFPGAAHPRALELDSAGDHRVAMAAATLAVLLDARLTLTGAECVAKSFPGFWRQLGVQEQAA
jgi:3-phosphoshikimate 1-carboxyvinyltransferase